jgi:hypothetical protein
MRFAMLTKSVRSNKISLDTQRIAFPRPKAKHLVESPRELDDAPTRSDLKELETKDAN